MATARLTAAGNAKSGAGKVRAITLTAGAAAAATATLVNAAAGTTPIVATLAAAQGTSFTLRFAGSDGLGEYLEAGIRLGALTGAGAEVCIEYE